MQRGRKESGQKAEVRKESDIISEKLILDRNCRMSKNWKLGKRKAYSGKNDFECRVQVGLMEGQLECTTVKLREDILGRFKRQWQVLGRHLRKINWTKISRLKESKGPEGIFLQYIITAQKDLVSRVCVV